MGYKWIFSVSVFSNFLRRALDTSFLYPDTCIREETLHQEDKGHTIEMANKYIGRIQAVIGCSSRNELSNISHLKQSSRTGYLLLLPLPLERQVASFPLQTG